MPSTTYVPSACSGGDEDLAGGEVREVAEVVHHPGVGEPLAVPRAERDVGARRGGDPDLLGVGDLGEHVVAVLLDGGVVGVEARDEDVLGDARKGGTSGAFRAGVPARSRVADALRRRREEDVAVAHRGGDRARGFLAVLVPRRVPEDDGVVGDVARDLVEGIADLAALVVGDDHAGLARVESETLHYRGLGRIVETHTPWCSRASDSTYCPSPKRRSRVRPTRTTCL